MLSTELAAELTKQLKAERRVPSEPHEQLTLSDDKKPGLTDGLHIGGTWQRFEQRHLTEELASTSLAEIDRPRRSDDGSLARDPQ